MTDSKSTETGRFDLSLLLKENSQISLRQQIYFVLKLSVPGMLAQLSAILMQYIDAAMAGALGADASAAIGLVSSSTWVLMSLQHALGIGFTVQTAHAAGAGDKDRAKNLLCNSLICSTVFCLFILMTGVCLSFKLPLWLGASPQIYSDAFWYFLIFCLSGPFYEAVFLMSGMLQCTGNMRLPAVLNALMCILDIIFNWIFIFGFKLGVKGAAIGSAVSAVIIAAVICSYTFFKSDYLKISGFKKFFLDTASIKKAVNLGFPVALQSSAFSAALAVVTKIIAPLGSVSLAANSFATTAESLCYMPGYGIQEAATTLTGQSWGAKRKDLVSSFGRITVIYGMLVMGITGILMYFVCPYIFKFITPDVQVQLLSVKILRIELFAEPLFGASIVAMGVLRGKGDTLVPGLLNLFSLWVVRLSLSFILVRPYGLTGIWIAMAAELCFRGVIMLLRMRFGLYKD